MISETWFFVSLCFFSSRRRHTRCALVTGVQTCALPISRLMAYKDEYEVARLYADPEFMQRMREQFSGDFTLRFNLAPPMLPGRDASGRPKKRSFGAWIDRKSTRLNSSH